MFDLARGAAAAAFDAELWSFWLWESDCGTSEVGNGKQLVISRRLFLSMPTMAPVAVVGKAEVQCFTIFMTTYFLLSALVTSLTSCFAYKGLDLDRGERGLLWDNVRHFVWYGRRGGVRVEDLLVRRLL